MSKSKRNVVVVSGSNKNVTGKVVKKPKPIKPVVETQADIKPAVEIKSGDKQLSKMELATQYLEDNPGLKRKDVLPVLINQFGLTKMGASTYWSLICARLNYKATKRDSKATS